MIMHNLRIGFDDYRARGTVHGDFLAAGYTMIVGVWTEEALVQFARRAWLARLIPVVAWEYINDDITLEEALLRVEKMANAPLPLGA